MPTRRRPWPTILLALLAASAVAAAIIVVGPAARAGGSSGRLVTVRRGVVQSTVSGSGTVEPASELSADFQTSGRIAQLYVKAGEHVQKGQLLARLRSGSARRELALAKDQLAAAEASSAAAAEAAEEASEPTQEDASADTPAASSASRRPASSGGGGEPSGESKGDSSDSGAGTSPRGSANGSPGGSADSGTSADSGATSQPSAASIASAAASAASAKVSVASAKASVENARQALRETRLRAPSAGTIAALNGAVGDSVSGSSSSSASGSGSGSASGSGGQGGGSGLGSSSSSASSSSGSDGLVVLTDLAAMKMVVPLSESDIGNVKAGQPATVSVNVLPDTKLAAHVTHVDMLPSSSSGSVVSYDVTLRLDQKLKKLKPGMSATAQIVVSRVRGAVTLPSTAIGGSGRRRVVTVLRDGKRVRRTVIVGKTGDDAVQIRSGLRPGDQVVAPSISSSALSGTRSSSASGNRPGGAGLSVSGGGPSFSGGGLGGGPRLRSLP